MKCYLDLIVGYKGLISEIDYIRKTTYSNENEEHEKLLLQVFNLLVTKFFVHKIKYLFCSYGVLWNLKKIW